MRTRKHSLGVQQRAQGACGRSRLTSHLCTKTAPASASSVRPGTAARGLQGRPRLSSEHSKVGCSGLSSSTSVPRSSFSQALPGTALPPSRTPGRAAAGPRPRLLGPRAGRCRRAASCASAWPQPHLLTRSPDLHRHNRRSGGSQQTTAPGPPARRPGPTKPVSK